MGRSYSIVLEGIGREYLCADTQNALRGMEALGGRGIPVGCRQGGCGVCKVEVLSGTYTAGVMSRSAISEDDERRQCVLACRIYPTSDLKLKVVGKMARSVEALKQEAAEKG
ncbi:MULTISPECIES: 2Fe-2S iron-sulfur cluster binding domain-containing protein [Methyloversatilis]|uniref:2Fe-2S iron-sulfur cluster binding domain-containing protein n=1 Tax=Methyloversatilis TaxID=378210 RepID=UPI003114C3CA